MSVLASRLVMIVFNAVIWSCIELIRTIVLVAIAYPYTQKAPIVTPLQSCKITVSPAVAVPSAAPSQS